MRPFLCLPVIAALLAGCTSFPQLDSATSLEAKRAPYPKLIPAEGLLAKRGEGRLTPESGEALLARAARLRARAAILRRIQAVDEETRLRIAGRLRQLGG
ncbi:MAG: hypothetical protein LJE68_07980 [Rhodobacter sp.]|jgi:type IV pilus biogenesis protein CpaD/CtpE|nr:hypothetical protein [Rhodobacter sp.]